MAEPQEETEIAQEQPQAQQASSNTADSVAKTKLSELIASAELQYSRKNYSKAAEIYSNATEQQASINGEDNPENAELLFQYGRCLYHVAVQTSDVLGGKVAAEKKKSKAPKEANGKAKEAAPSNGVTASSSDTMGAIKEEKSSADASNPYFSITGDENWTDSEDEEAEGEEQEQEDDDFTNAYDVLEYARVLFQRKLDSIAAPDSEAIGKGKQKATGLSPAVRHIKERLADTRSLQAEICLEHERFADAVTDARANLDLCQELYGMESNLVAEAHYKLSLALEFASAEVPDEAENGNVDMKMREEAANEMEKAVKSVQARIEREQKAAEEQSDTQAKSKQSKEIAGTKELLKELEDRLVDLRAPPQNPLEGIFSDLLGPKSGVEATKSANDLSRLVKKKKKEPEKRKRDDEDELAADGADGSESKKAKVEDA